MEELLCLLYDISQDIPDQKYRDIMSALTQLNNEPKSSEFVRGDYTLAVTYESDVLVTAWKKNGKLHRDEAPAEIRYKDGQIQFVTWYQNGEKHCDGAPARLMYRDGRLVAETWYQNGAIHRETPNGGWAAPARTFYNHGLIMREEWYRNNRFLSKKIHQWKTK